MGIDLSLFIRIVMMIIAFMVPFTVLWSYHVRMENEKEKEKIIKLCCKCKLDNDVIKKFNQEFERVRRGITNEKNYERFVATPKAKFL